MKKNSINSQTISPSDIFKRILPLTRTNSKAEILIDLYSSKKFNEISWLQICDDVKKHANSNLMHRFLVELLNNDLYKNEYKDNLNKLLPMLEETKNISLKHYQQLFCGYKVQSLKIIKNEAVETGYSFIQKRNDEIIIRDDGIADIVSKTLAKVQITTKAKALSQLYIAKKTDELSWIEICNDVNKYKHYKFMFLLIIELLNQGLYTNEYADNLYELLPMFNELKKRKIKHYQSIFCGKKITDLIIFTHNRDGHYLRLDYLTSDNSFIKKLYLEFLVADRMYTRWIKDDITEMLEISLGDYATAITSVEKFNDRTFWKQVNFYKEYYHDNAQLYTYSLRTILGFYRWLHNTHPECDFFKDSYTITKTLLFQKSISRLINEDYYFTTLNPHSHPGDKTKICFILKGFENSSTTLISEDNINIDISKIEYSLYRHMVISYIITSSSLASTAMSSSLCYVCDGLKFITDMKSQKRYPNPDFKYLTTQEAVLIRKFLYDSSLEPSTLNNRIGSVRRFLMWASDTKNIKFDSMFFDYLTQYDEPSMNNGNAISDEKLIALNKIMLEDIRVNKLARMYYLIFHLLIQTEFRISTICHLKTTDIHPSAKPNQYIIYTNSKTSNGENESYVITDLTYHMLISYIEDTEFMRDSCNNNNLSGYIFLYEGYHNSHYLLYPKKFAEYLKLCCSRLSFEETYSAINLRDTHMTKALEHNMRHNKSDLELNVLSGHKHIDTTKNHYIELELEKMLEATYGIIIGDTKLIDADAKLVEKIPDKLESKKYDVEDGCGKCTHDHCVISSSLPCMSCKYFITTVEHEKYFIKAIDNVDRLIEQSSTRHDIEDFTTIKTLYVLYLEAIYKRKEEIYD